MRTPSASNLCTGHSNKPGRLGLKHLLYRRHQGVVDGNGYQQHTSISQVTQHMQFSLAGSCAAKKCMRSQCPQTCALPVVNATAHRHLRHWMHSLAAQHTNTVATQRWAPQHMTPNLQEQRQKDRPVIKANKSNSGRMLLCAWSAPAGVRCISSVEHLVRSCVRSQQGCVCEHCPMSKQQAPTCCEGLAPTAHLHAGDTITILLRRLGRAGECRAEHG